MMELFDNMERIELQDKLTQLIEDDEFPETPEQWDGETYDDNHILCVHLKDGTIWEDYDGEDELPAPEFAIFSDREVLKQWVAEEYDIPVETIDCVSVNGQ